MRRAIIIVVFYFCAAANGRLMTRLLFLAIIIIFRNVSYSKPALPDFRRAAHIDTEPIFAIYAREMSPYLIYEAWRCRRVAFTICHAIDRPAGLS